ncbi:glycosyltransferase family 25 protein [Helicobacter bizzozeronii]|uniref:glycosyltransferase family 25 protein n=1 Tax=Helicobacter bizzozeronii TaxID=56877 RepID=UPI00024E6099|nr:glycosyltransferase family 25 protein [Helicobacter bizzozeronii]CCF80694.1 putative lipopolysaccharide biosynthesis protein [Helicobacter bizzozeronii CCUG 35545]
MILPIYFISLKDHPRRAHCQSIIDNPPAQEGDLKLQFQIFDAIDKHSDYFKSGLIENSYSPKWLKESEWFRGMHGRELLPEELGCYASHYMLWLKCIELNHPIVVLEDDVMLKPNFYESVAHCVQSPFDFVRLFATFWEIKTKRSAIAHIGGSQVLPTDPKVEVILKEHFYLSAFDVFAASAYYLTPKAAKAFVSASLHFTEPADNLLSLVHAHKIPNFTYIPLSAGFSKYHTISTITSDDSTDLRTSTYKPSMRFLTRFLTSAFFTTRRYYYYRLFLKRYAHLR